MAPLEKLAVVPKMSEEASFLQKWTCLSSSLHCSRKTAICRVYLLLSAFREKHFISHVHPIIMVFIKIT